MVHLVFEDRRAFLQILLQDFTFDYIRKTFQKNYYLERIIFLFQKNQTRKKL